MHRAGLVRLVRMGLVYLLVAAAAAVTGCIADPREVFGL